MPTGPRQLFTGDEVCRRCCCREWQVQRRPGRGQGLRTGHDTRIAALRFLEVLADFKGQAQFGKLIRHPERAAGLRLDAMQTMPDSIGVAGTAHSVECARTRSGNDISTTRCRAISLTDTAGIQR